MIMKKGLIMEGGAMRGMFTSGVLDVFLENGIEFDGAIGVSAGATFGCNFKSRQIGRAINFRMNLMFLIWKPIAKIQWTFTALLLIV